MKVKYFRCTDCFFQFIARVDMVKSNMQCGALSGYKVVEGKEVPLGCGGTVKEITEEQAMETYK